MTRSIRWEHAPDRRVRHVKEFPELPLPPMGLWDAEPPRLLGWFNCRGEYVLPGESWGDPEGDPVSDIREFIATVMATTETGTPNLTYLPERTFVRLKRRTMTKRGFRRWRGRWKGRVRHG